MAGGDDKALIPLWATTSPADLGRAMPRETAGPVAAPPVGVGPASLPGQPRSLDPAVWLAEVRRDWAELFKRCFGGDADLRATAELVLLGFTTQDVRVAARVLDRPRAWVAVRASRLRRAGVWLGHLGLGASWLDDLIGDGDPRVGEIKLTLDVMVAAGRMRRDRVGRYAMSDRGPASPPGGAAVPGSLPTAGPPPGDTSSL